jgi:hypothetical protein
VKLIGLLSFYDETPALLAASITSLAHTAGISHLVAVDGRYFLYQDDRATSHPYEHHTILDTCRAAGIGCTIHIPNGPYLNNEIEKRTLMFQLAQPLAEPNTDWLMVMDADQLAYGTTPAELHAELQNTEQHACTITFTEPLDPKVAEIVNTGATSSYRVRSLYRATPGLRVVDNHYTYVDDAGRTHRVNDDRDAHHLDTLRMEHRPTLRPTSRRAAKDAYYTLRDHVAAEHNR